MFDVRTISGSYRVFLALVFSMIFCVGVVTLNFANIFDVTLYWSIFGEFPALSFDFFIVFLLVFKITLKFVGLLDLLSSWSLGEVMVLGFECSFVGTIVNNLANVDSMKVFVGVLSHFLLVLEVADTLLYFLVVFENRGNSLVGWCLLNLLAGSSVGL